MQTYPKALNSCREVVHVNDASPGGGPYTCLGCEAPMIARLKDDKRAKHFAHKSKGKCSGETYLHVLAKHVFKHTWQNCCREGKPLWLSLPRRLVCPHMPEGEEPCEIGRLGCSLRESCWPLRLGDEKRTDYDLTQRYKYILMEKGDAGFIPDLLLVSEDRQQKLYIEIKVKSAVSGEKAAAGHKIIEIPIRTEADIKLIDTCFLSAPEVKPYNFKLDTPAKDVPANCELLLARERMRQQEEARLRLAEIRLRQEAAAKDQAKAQEQAQEQARLRQEQAQLGQEQARLQQEHALLEVKRVRLEAEGLLPDAPTEWSWNGHPIRILFLRGVWILSVDREYRGEFNTFTEANTRAERIISRFGSPATDKVYNKIRNAGLDGPSSFVDEVLAVFGGRLLDDDE